jgi:thiamine-monophosphate kinase
VHSYQSRETSSRSSATLLAGADAQDDCAVFGLQGEQDLVVGSDYVRGPKFRLFEYGLLNEYDLGYYLVAANVSDIAAMGAQPIGLLSVVRYPPTMTDVTFQEVMQGIHDACRKFKTPNVGGDIGGAERLILSATALGVCRSGGSLLRSGAQVGDLVCLTGPTGKAGAAMAYFRAGKTEENIEKSHRADLLAGWTRPQARVSAGIVLGKSGVVTSCQDTSDGLKATLECIASASNKGISVLERQLKISEAVKDVCQLLELDPIATTMGDSVDFELVFTVSEDDYELLRKQLEDTNSDIHPIGIVSADRGVHLETSSGQRKPLPGKAWRHRQE